MRLASKRLASIGLRWRLAGWVAVVMMICTGITFVAVYRGTGSQLRRQVDREISGEVSALARALGPSDARLPREISERAARYVSGRPFGASSTLLYAVVPGVATSSNRPELFSAPVAGEGESPSARTRENRLTQNLLSARAGYSTLELPDVGSLRLLKRIVLIAGGPRVTVGAGESLTTVSHAQEDVAGAFILASVLALAGALLASYLIGTRVSRPLRRMAAVAARVDAGDLHPRIHDPGGQGHEVRVLADAFNHMLDRLTDAFAGQRAFVADASHELRTPLTVIRGQLEVLAAQENPPGEEVRRVEGLLQAEIARITRLVDDLLLLAKSEQTQFLRIAPIDLPAYLSELWDGMSLIAKRRFELGPIPAGLLRADPDRLAQALRNLAANAIEHTEPEHGLVRMRVEQTPNGRIRFLVEDDGRGIAAEQLEHIFDRFHRIDAARDRASGGTGLGLAIVRAIAVAHGGRVAAGRSPEGGARIELELPRFTPARQRPESADAQAGRSPAQDAGVPDPVTAALGPRA
ncbi:MAG: ATP-binding protein [Actinomycetota bacterium]|nr:ATP-binding protein [Actinomycetota bacterium]